MWVEDASAMFDYDLDLQVDVTEVKFVNDPALGSLRAIDYSNGSLTIIGKFRSEEHTSELQSPCNLVCRLLLEKKKYDKPASPLLSPGPASPASASGGAAYTASSPPPLEPRRSVPPGSDPADDSPRCCVRQTPT